LIRLYYYYCNRCIRLMSSLVDSFLGWFMGLRHLTDGMICRPDGLMPLFVCSVLLYSYHVNSVVALCVCCAVPRCASLCAVLCFCCPCACAALSCLGIPVVLVAASASAAALAVWLLLCENPQFLWHFHDALNPVRQHGTKADRKRRHEPGRQGLEQILAVGLLGVGKIQRS